MACGAYLVSLPQVREALAAADWKESGQLTARYQAEGYEVSALLFDALSILSTAKADAEAHHYATLAEEQKRK